MYIRNADIAELILNKRQNHYLDLFCLARVIIIYILGWYPVSKVTNGI